MKLTTLGNNIKRLPFWCFTATLKISFLEKSLIWIISASLSENCIIGSEKLEELRKPVFRETGDIAEIGEKGLIYRYRKNRIIKRFGHRINLSKTEEIITQTTGLANRCVWIKDSSKLITYIAIENFTKSHEEKIIDKLQVKLLSVLSEASYPDHVYLLRRFPLTCHGKIDDKSLTNYFNMMTIEKSNISSSTGEIFCSLCSKYLGLSADVLVEVKDRFFMELGGNSITVLQLDSELKDILQSDYPHDFLKSLFEQSLKSCLNVLKNYKDRKRTRDELDLSDSKINSLDTDFNALWKYDLKACVDSSPLVFLKQ